MIEEFVLKKITESAFKGFSKIASSGTKDFLPNIDSFRKRIANHLTYVANWSSEVVFADMVDAKSINTIYVDLNFRLTPLNLSLNPTGNQQDKVELLNVFDNSDRHVVILGQPGAGKTTTMRLICNKVIFDDTFYPQKFNFPLLIRFRELIESGSIYEHIFTILGYDHDESTGKKIDHSASYIKKCVISLLNEFNLLVVLDGYDEIVSPSAKNLVLSQIRELCLHSQNSKIIVTSRSSDFPSRIENTTVYEISSLTKKQIRLFITKYLGGINDEELFNKIEASPFSDTAIRPLTLAHLCAIYERYGDIPDKPKTIYRKIVYLLLENWDAQNGVKRHSTYGSFTPERKLEFLNSLAFELTTWINRTSFSSNDLLQIYHKIHNRFSLPEKEILMVINELETHNGLFIKSGFDTFEFSHKSIQEYLTAEYIIKLGGLFLNEHTVNSIPNELAIAVAISSHQNIYFAQVICSFVARNSITIAFLDTFLNRLLLEKPDFVPDKLFGVSLLVIVEKYYTTRANSDTLDRFIEAFDGRSSIEQLHANFDEDESRSGTDPEYIPLKSSLILPYSINVNFPKTFHIPRIYWD